MKKCKIKGCSGVHSGKGYCKSHYDRFKKYGSATVNGYEKRYGTPIHRIMSNLDFKSNGCWEWKGGTVPGGYAQTRIDGVKRFIHRYMYEYYNETKIPKEHFVCHSCDNPKCCNPDHLWIGTPTDNSQDCIRKGRFKKASGEYNHQSTISDNFRIKLGKEFYKENYVIKSNGYRRLVEKYNLSIHVVYCAIKWYENKYLKRR